MKGLIEMLGIRRFCPAVLVIAAALVSIAGGARADPSASTCDYLPSQGVQIVGPYKTEGAEQEHCFAQFASSRAATIVIRQFSAASGPGSPADTFQASLDSHSGWQETSGYGDRAILCPSADADCAMPLQTGELMFQRGCYLVAAGWDAATEQQIRSELSNLDSRLQSASCGGRPEAPAAAPTGVGSSLGLACDTASLQASGHVDCTAGMSNASGEATYAWTVDGQAQSATGAVLTLENLATGPHAVSVTARDAAGNEQGPQSTSFTRYAARTPGTSPSDWIIPAILVAGGGVGITIALGRLAGRRRRRQPPPAGPEQPGPAGPSPQRPRQVPASGPEAVAIRAASPPGGPETEVRPRPAAAPAEGPEPVVQGRRGDRQRPPPTVLVRLILRPSVLTELIYNEHTPQLVGDGVDFMIAGYDLIVGPPGEWEVDKGPRYRLGDARGQSPEVNAAVKPTWRVSCGSCRLMDELDQVADELGRTVSVTDWRRPLSRHAEPLTDARNAALVAPWRDEMDHMDVEVSVAVRVRPTDGGEPPRIVTGSAATRPDQRVPILGAQPKAALTAFTDRDFNSGRPPEEGGTAIAHADGKDVVHIQPTIYLFDQPYAGGVIIDEPEDLNIELAPAAPPLRRLMLRDLFEPRHERPDDLQARHRSREGLALRCKFRLNDQVLNRSGGFPIQLSVRPSRYAFGTENWVGPYDWLLSLHYESCGEHYETHPMPKPDPASVIVCGSKIKIENPMPARLPKTSVGEDQFVSVLRARVVSLMDEPIDGSILQRDLDPPTLLDQWRFQFWYDAPAEAWRQKIDPGCRGEPKEPDPPAAATAVLGLAQPGIEASASGALGLTTNPDDVGLIVFGDTPFVRYDHRRLFELSIDHDKRSAETAGQNKYIGGQTCDVQVEFRATMDKPDKSPLDGPTEWLTYSGKPIHIEAIDKEFLSCKIKVIAQSLDDKGQQIPLEGAEVRLSATGPDRVVYFDDPEAGRYTAITRTTDADGIANFNIAAARMNPYQVGVTWQTHPQTEEYRGWRGEPDRDPSGELEPWEMPDRPETWAKGTQKKEGYPNLIINDGDTVTLIFPASTRWALQTDTQWSVGGSIVIAGAGVTYLSAYLINRALMPTGALPGGVGEVFKTHKPTNEQAKQWKRIFLSAAYANVGKSLFPVPLSGDVSDPGPSDFRTTTPVVWEDFDRSDGTFWQLEGAAVRGKGYAWVTFWGVTTRDKRIDVTSMVVGTNPNVGGTKGAGFWNVMDLERD